MKVFGNSGCIASNYHAVNSTSRFSINAEKIVRVIAITAIAALALYAISSIPGASAESKMCSIACAPLPGEREDAPETACNLLCEEGEKVAPKIMPIPDIKPEVLPGAGPSNSWVKRGTTLLTGAANAFTCQQMCAPQGGEVAAARFMALTYKTGEHYYKGEIGQSLLSVTRLGTDIGCFSLKFVPGMGEPMCVACCVGKEMGFSMGGSST